MQMIRPMNIYSAALISQTRWFLVEVSARVFVVFLVFLYCLAINAPAQQEKILLAVRQGGKYGFINVRGNIVIPTRFDWASQFNEDRALVLISGKYGYIGETGAIAVPAKFDGVDRFSAMV